jgi:hypothetical protein
VVRDLVPEDAGRDRHFSPKVEYYSIDEFFWQGVPAPKQSY